MLCGTKWFCAHTQIIHALGVGTIEQDVSLTASAESPSHAGPADLEAEYQMVDARLSDTLMQSLVSRMQRLADEDSDSISSNDSWSTDSD